MDRAGLAPVREFAKIRDVEYVDLPTGRSLPGPRSSRGPSSGQRILRDMTARESRYWDHRAGAEPGHARPADAARARATRRHRRGVPRARPVGTAPRLAVPRPVEPVHRLRPGRPRHCRRVLDVQPKLGALPAPDYVHRGGGTGQLGGQPIGKMRLLKPAPGTAQCAPSIPVTGCRPAQAVRDHRFSLGPVRRAHPVPGFGQLGRKMEPLSGAGRAARARAGHPELDGRAIEVDRAEGMLDDVGDSAEPDVFPLRRHPCTVAWPSAEPAAGSPARSGTLPCLARSGYRPEITTSRCAAPVITAAPATAPSTAVIVFP